MGGMSVVVYTTSNAGNASHRGRHRAVESRPDDSRFDNDYPNRNTSLPGLFDLTPASISYTCRVGAAENPVGELSWTT
jgi:hypothetical protein